MKEVLDQIVYGDEPTVARHILGFASVSPDEQRMLLGWVGALRAPDRRTAYKIFDQHTCGGCTMVVLQAPWLEKIGSGGCWPVMLLQRGGAWKIYGIILPFNEIASLLSYSEQAASAELLTWWLTKSHELIARFGTPEAYKQMERDYQESQRRKGIETEPREWDIPDSPDDILGPP